MVNWTMRKFYTVMLETCFPQALFLAVVSRDIGNSLEICHRFIDRTSRWNWRPSRVLRGKRLFRKLWLMQAGRNGSFLFFSLVPREKIHPGYYLKLPPDWFFSNPFQLPTHKSDFGGLEVACWPLVPKFASSKPGRSSRIFQDEKILSTPSFGGEVKPSVPCRRFTACKRFLNSTWKSGISGKIHRSFLAHIVSTFGY